MEKPQWKVRLIFLFLFSIIIWGGCSSSEQRKIAHYQKGLEYVALDNVKAAILEFRNAIQIDPKYAEARYQLGLAYLKVNEPREAFKQFERAASLNPNNLDAHIKAGEILFMGKKKEESRARVERASSAS